MKAILHIGTEKTGTKTLQKFLQRNRRRLLEQGILYTRSAGVRNNRQLAVLSYPPNRRDDATMRLGINSDAALLAHQDGVKAALADELESHSGDFVLFSTEHLQSRLRSREDILRLQKALEDIGVTRVQIIVYLRDPVAICRSLYASSIATGSTAAGPPAPDNVYFATICDHRRTLKNWAAVFGEEMVEPRLFEPESWPDRSLVGDFCAAVGIELNEQFVIPEARNESLSHFGLALLRHINEQVPRIQNGQLNEKRARLVELVREHTAGAAYQPPLDVVEVYRKEFADSNEWVRARYFPDRSQLFTRRAQNEPSSIRASEAEVGAMARLVVAAWQAGADTTDSAH